MRYPSGGGHKINTYKIIMILRYLFNNYHYKTVLNCITWLVNCARVQGNWGRLRSLRQMEKASIGTSLKSFLQSFSLSSGCHVLQSLFHVGLTCAPGSMWNLSFPWLFLFLLLLLSLSKLSHSSEAFYSSLWALLLLIAVFMILPPPSSLSLHVLWGNIIHWYLCWSFQT